MNDCCRSHIGPSRRRLAWESIQEIPTLFRLLAVKCLSVSIPAIFPLAPKLYLQGTSRVQVEVALRECDDDA